MNNIDSSVNKPDLNGRYGTIEQYRYVLIRIGFEQVTIKENRYGSLSIVVVKKIRKGIDNRVMIIIGLAKRGRFCMRKREEYAF